MVDLSLSFDLMAAILTIAYLAYAFSQAVVGNKVSPAERVRGEHRIIPQNRKQGGSRGARGLRCVSPLYSLAMELGRQPVNDAIPELALPLPFIPKRSLVDQQVARR